MRRRTRLFVLVAVVSITTMLLSTGVLAWDPNYSGSPQGGNYFLNDNGSIITAQAEYFTWTSNQVNNDWDPVMDFTHDQGEANYSNAGTDIPNNGTSAQDDNGSGSSKEEVELDIQEGNVVVNHQYRYYVVEWSQISGYGKPNISYEYGAIWNRSHDWLDGQEYGYSALRLPVGTTPAYADEEPFPIKSFRGTVLNGKAELEGVMYNNGKVRGRIKWDVVNENSRQSHVVATHAFAEKLQEKDAGTTSVTVVFDKAIPHQDVLALAERTGLKITQVYAGGAADDGRRFSASGVADQKGQFDTAAMTRILAAGGAKYRGITAVEGEISTDHSALGALFNEARVAEVDASTDEARETLANAFGVSPTGIDVSVPNAHWFVPLN